MFKMYARATRVFCTSFPLFAVFAALAVALDVIAETTGSRSGVLVASLMVFGFVSLFSHRLLLSGQKAAVADVFKRQPVGPLAGAQKPFMLRLVGLWLVGFLAWAFFAWLLYGIVPGPKRTLPMVVMMLGILPAGLLVYVVLALFGTALPAAAALQDARFSTALQRGKQSFWTTLLLLLTGNGLFTLASFSCVILLGNSLWEDAPRAVTLLLDFLVQLAGLFSIHLTATALCMAYEAAEPQAAAEAVG